MHRSPIGSRPLPFSWENLRYFVSSGIVGYRYRRNEDLWLERHVMAVELAINAVIALLDRPADEAAANAEEAREIMTGAVSLLLDSYEGRPHPFSSRVYRYAYWLMHVAYSLCERFAALDGLCEAPQFRRFVRSGPLKQY